MSRTNALTLAALALLAARPARGAEPELLARDAATACAASAATPATLAQVLEKTRNAAALLEREGRAAFPKFRGARSPFIFGGTYVWIHAVDGTMLVHPLMPGLEGIHVLPLRDWNRKIVFVEMNRAVAQKGSGWVEYLWPKPGSREPSSRISYARLVRHGQEAYVVVAEVFDWSLEDVRRAGLL